MKAPSSPWPEVFAARHGLAPWTVFVLLGLLIAILPSLNIYLASRGGPYAAPDVFRAWVTALVNSGVIGFLVAYIIWAVRRVRSDLLAASELFATDDPEAFVAAIVARPGRGALAIGLGAALVVYAYTAAFDAFESIRGKDSLFMLLWIWLAPLLLILWLTVFYSVAVLTTMATRLGKAATASLHVDLLDTTPLAAVSAIAVRLTLIAVISLVSLPIQQLLTGDLEPKDWVPPTILMLCFGTWTVLRPIFGTHTAIVRAKAAELARIDGALAVTASDGDGHTTAADHRERNIEQLASSRFANLLQWREHVEAASEWPLSRSSRGRLFFYLVIPPLAWLAAAFTEALVEASL